MVENPVLCLCSPCLPIRTLNLLAQTTVVVVIGMIWHYLYTHGGWWAVFKYWGMPYLVFNFWLSTYTYFHHKSTEIGWIPVCHL